MLWPKPYRTGAPQPREETPARLISFESPNFSNVCWASSLAIMGNAAEKDSDPETANAKCSLAIQVDNRRGSVARMISLIPVWLNPL